MKTYGGVEVWFHAFLTSELDWGEWSQPEVKSPRYLLDRWLDGPQSRSRRRGVEKNFLPLLRNGAPAVHLVA
jgi:hypothetical protein